jgi:hypothetical protein
VDETRDLIKERYDDNKVVGHYILIIIIMQNKADLGKKKIVAQALIQKIETDNTDSQIRTHIVEGYRKPERIVLKDTMQEGFVPDVMAETTGKKDLYEIELNEHQYTLEKWRLFSLYCKKSKGSFSIITPKEKLDHIKNLLDVNQIHARLIYYT